MWRLFVGCRISTYTKLKQRPHVFIWCSKPKYNINWFLFPHRISSRHVRQLNSRHCTAWTQISVKLKAWHTSCTSAKHTVNNWAYWLSDVNLFLLFIDNCHDKFWISNANLYKILKLIAIQSFKCTHVFKAAGKRFFLHLTIVKIIASNII